MVNLQPSGSEIPDAWSIKLAVSLIIIFYLTNPENKTKKIFNTALILLHWVKVLFLTKNAYFLPKNTDISNVKKVLALTGTISEIKYVCVLTYQILSF